MTLILSPRDAMYPTYLSNCPRKTRMRKHAIHDTAQRQIALDLVRLGQVVTQYRKQQVVGIRTIKKSAAKAGVSRTVFSRLEKGKAVGFDKLLRIAPVIGLRVALVPANIDEDGTKAWRRGWVQATRVRFHAFPDALPPPIPRDKPEPRDSRTGASNVGSCIDDA
ncbi:hypothetical protein PQQ77_02635 [Paraburkholderia strydomiana]|uniref:hypothetical protein n=1 Tax=Paraburkholderia strydomiana TaxID=1245417 RepID=UPI0038BDDC53